jgi:hypothetical protein
MKCSKVFLVLQVVAAVTSAVETDYCSEAICKVGKHIACENSGEYGEACPSNAKIVELSETDIVVILNEHNSLRNKIASGNESRFSTAAKMTTMVSGKERNVSF